MQQRLRILVVSYYFPPLGLSGVQRTAKLVKYLPDNGIDVSVLTVNPGAYFAFDETLSDELDRPGITVHRTGSVDPTQIPGMRRRTVGLPAEGRRGPMARLSQWIFQPDNKIGWYPFAVRMGRRLLQRERHDLVFVSAPPYTGVLVARQLARRFRLPLVLDFRDDWVGNPRHTYPTRWHRCVAARMESKAVQDAHEIHVINRVIRDALCERNGLDGEGVHIVPQGFDPEDFTNLESADIFESTTCTFLYTGVFYDAQKPDVFLRAFAAAAAVDDRFREKARAHFMGLVPDHLHDLVRELDLERLVVHHGYVSHTGTVRAQHAADVLWLTIGVRPGSEGISTGKLYEYMGSGRPILGLVPEGVARDDIMAHGAGFVAHPDRIPEVSERLLELFDMWERGTLPIAEANGLEMFDRRLGARRIADRFRTLVRRSTRTPVSWPD